MPRLSACLLFFLLLGGLSACGSGSADPGVTDDGTSDDGTNDDGTSDDDGGDDGTPVIPPRRVSPHEVDCPYVGDTAAFWARSDLFIMSPDLEPLDRWPDEVNNPSTYGVKVIVMLPGDYRARNDGSLPDGILLIRDSGTASEPILVTFAPEVGADLSACPHPTERFGQSEALLLGFRVFAQDYQYFYGLTFANGFAGSWIRLTTGCTIDSCLWHETQGQPLRIRYNANNNVVQRCVMQRFDPSLWGSGDTVAIQVSDEFNINNKIVSNVILNFTDSYQHTDRDGDDYGLGAGTIIDNNFMGFTSEAYLQEAAGELLCGENSLDFKMGGTQASPVRVTNNVFFGARAAKAGCAATGSGGYAITMHRRGTWVEMTDNLFIDNDSGIFLNAYFLNNEPAQGRIDPNLTFSRNVFSRVTSYATAFPSRTGHVMTGSSAATFTDNVLLDCDRLMESEPIGPGQLRIENNEIFGPIELAPRDATTLESDGNVLHPTGQGVPTVVHIPWVGRTLLYDAAP